MKTNRIALIVMITLCVGSIAFADRTLTRAEILQIFQELTSQPRKTWIPAGTIEAQHEEFRASETTNEGEIQQEINRAVQEYQNNPNKRELTPELQTEMLAAIPFNVRYKLSNEYTMNSSVLVKYDGERFYWEISVNSRTDSVTPPTDLEGNFMTEQFNLDWNAKRIFSWDGEKYTIYSQPVNQAVVDTTGRTPHVVNGPLTAGLIPWGYGYYTYENLSRTASSAVEESLGSQTHINLTLQNSDGSEMLFTLDPQKEYAVVSCLITSSDSIISKQYDNFQLVLGNWIPKAIVIDKYDSMGSNLLESDFWNFSNITDITPVINNIEYKPNALIEYRSDIIEESLTYHYSHLVDIELPLAERIAYVAAEGTRPQNCATAALQYAALQLGRDISGQRLTRLAGGSNQATSLYAMKQFAQSLGFYCRAVKTDLNTLKNLSNCRAILHIPGQNHFVLLDHIDSRYVWIVDLASSKFFYSTDTNLFGMDWTEGTALLISNRPIRLQGTYTVIADNQLREINGGSGYSCTRLLQEYDVVYCTYAFGECWGYYQVYFTRYGCESAPSGSCQSYILLRMAESPCINNPYYPWACDITGEWDLYYMRACD